MSFKIFISYAKEDYEQALNCYDRLAKEGMSPWLDEKHVLPGQNWGVEIDKAFNEANIVILLLSKKSVTKRGFVQREANKAIDLLQCKLPADIYVIPLLLEPCEVPSHIAERLQYVDLNTQDAWHRVLAALKLAANQQTLNISQSNAETPSWAIDAGRDEYGQWADIAVKSHVQRMRWIPPGKFLIGSPESEAESFSSEHPQHMVIMNSGYWIADTVCTQAFWIAVTNKKNPSYFTDDEQNPVEQINWTDAKNFLDRLTKIIKLQNMEFDLPTEAEWEYACRAGSSSPFWWGDTLDTSLANYDRDNPYKKGQKGEYRDRTLPVKSFQPNPWGLWQMHGNVWEWCLDIPRTFSEKEYLNQEGQPRKNLRVLRGGSWHSSGGCIRAARRAIHHFFNRNASIGFRFVLRKKPL